MENNIVRKHSKRSPSHPLMATLGFLEKVYKAVGNGPFDRETFAHALGHETLSGPSSTKIASLVHFGLLKKARDGYAISGLADRLIAPTSEEERRRALVESARRPVVYGHVFERFKNQLLPTMLANVLHREYGVDRKQAERAAENFRQTAEFAGLLRNGVLHAEPAEEPGPAAPPEPGNGSEDAGKCERWPEFDGTHVVAAPPSAQGARIFCIPLNGPATRVAVLQLPVPIQQADLDRIRRWIGFVEEDLKEAKG